jgi:hypothetical protein
MQSLTKRHCPLSAGEGKLGAAEVLVVMRLFETDITA